MDSASERGVQSIVFMKSAQIGATEAINNILGYFIHQDPAPILVVQISEGEAQKYSKEKLAPMIRETPVLKSRISDPKSRDSDNTILSKRFPGGHLGIVGANAPSGLRARARRVVLFDEVDGYPDSAGTEGDPIDLAEQRMVSYGTRRLSLKVSTPTVKGFSRIELAYSESDQRRYHVPCPECGHMQHLEWRNIRFTDRDPSTTVYVCDECDTEIPEVKKRAMLARGEWRPGKPGARIRGYHLNALYSPFQPWSHYVQQHLDAIGNPERRQVWVNTVLGETWEEDGDRVSPDALYERREAYAAEVPKGVGLLTAAVDVQGDRLELLVRGWGRGEESWLVAWLQIWGDPGQERVWEELDEQLVRHFAHESGSILQIMATFVDSGGHHTEHVYRFCRERVGRRVWATKGYGEIGRPLVSRPAKTKKSDKTKTPVWPMGVSTAKDLLFSRLKITDSGPGFMHFPEVDWCDPEYFAQLTAEKVVTVVNRGIPKRVYRKTRPRNEALDLEVYALGALASLGPAVLQNLGQWVDVAQAGDLKPADVASPKRKRRRVRSRGVEG